MKLNPLARLSIQTAFILVLGVATSFSAEVKAGDVLERYTLKDNHGKIHSLRDDTEVVLLSFDMEKSKEIHTWLAQKDPRYLEKNKTEYIADITKMPAVITKMFAGPKMAKYPFQILLANDKNFAPRFPKSGTKITTLVLDPGKKITHILFLNNMNEVGSLISR